MSAIEQSAKKAVLFCTCSGACPSMAGVDFWALAERVRVELGNGIEFMALHPRLGMAKETTDTVFQKIKATVQNEGGADTKEKQS